MLITLNGEEKELINEISLNDLIENLGFNPQGVVAQLNHEVIDRDKFNLVILKNGDKLELVRLVGGG